IGQRYVAIAPLTQVRFSFVDCAEAAVGDRERGVQAFRLGIEPKGFLQVLYRLRIVTLREGRPPETRKRRNSTRCQDKRSCEQRLSLVRPAIVKVQAAESD